MSPILRPADLRPLTIPGLPGNVVAHNPDACTHNGITVMTATRNMQRDKAFFHTPGFAPPRGLSCRYYADTVGARSPRQWVANVNDAALVHPVLDPRYWYTDFRLFEFRGERTSPLLICNHDRAARVSRERLDVQMLAEYDDESGEFLPSYEPVVEGLVRRPKEKNWVYFEVDSKLYMIYSLVPYRLYRAIESPRSARPLVKGDKGTAGKEVPVSPLQRGLAASAGGFAFEPKLIVSQGLGIPPSACTRNGSGAAPISPSANPVAWNDDHLLLFAHTFSGAWPKRTYCHYAYLIGRKSLLIEAICERPVLCEPGDQGDYPMMIYVSGALDNGKSVTLFAGLGDSICAMADIDKSVFSWRSL